MIEDDERLAGMLATYLAPHGLELSLATTARDGLAMLRQGGHGFALVLLDLMLPDADGLEVCRQIRGLDTQARATPIVMLTAKGDPFDRDVGLDVGADRELREPDHTRALLESLRAALSRPPLALALDARPQVLHFGRVVIDRGARAVRVDGQPRVLTSHQFDLLVALAERAGRVLSREQLLDAVRGAAFDPFDRSIDVHIGRLRLAIEDDPRQPRRIITVRGAGSVFARVQDA